MKKFNGMKLFSLLFLLTTIHFSFFSTAQPSGDTDYPIGNVMLTIPGNPATSAAVSWQSVAEDTTSIAQTVYPPGKRSFRKI
jgi:hypothetical protein